MWSKPCGMRIHTFIRARGALSLSAQHEAEIRRLLANACRKDEAWEARSPPSPDTTSPFGENSYNSPSIAARSFRSARAPMPHTHAQHSQHTPAPDFGDEYTRKFDRRMHALSLRPTHGEEGGVAPSRSPSTPMHSRRTVYPGSAPRALRHGTPRVDRNEDAPHLGNLELALQQFHQCAPRIPNAQALVTPALCTQMDCAVNAAQAVNRGLRHAISTSLETRMSFALRPGYDAMDQLAAAFDSALGSVLRDSDDQIRCLTDTLIVITGEERQRQRHAGREPHSPRHLVPANPAPRAPFRSASRPPTGPWHDQLFAQSPQDALAHSQPTSPSLAPLRPSALFSPPVSGTHSCSTPAAYAGAPACVRERFDSPYRSLDID
ncbi:hypothetical protein MVES_000808 [Malassezia vespertilionis]|uniref:Uncharacterized protein n=1 Tax=Malassezia vespertilionis TaxID=2020962 RepID=A0A2N1JE80_9BASI|nr:hypothetical protein MVES_000808 [Malassezia vespertilionis]